MTQHLQESELENKVRDHLFAIHLSDDMGNGEVEFRLRHIMELVTADRKRVALEARIDENNMYIRELTRHYFPSGPGEPHIPFVQFHERIAELKAQQEEPKDEL